MTTEQVAEISFKIFQEIMHVEDIIARGAGSLYSTGIFSVSQIADYFFVFITKGGGDDELGLTRGAVGIDVPEAVGLSEDPDIVTGIRLAAMPAFDSAHQPFNALFHNPSFPP